MTIPDRNAAAVRLAIAVSGLMIAYQVAGRATRDALFLSHFNVTTLPRMVALAAIVSLVAALAMSRILGRFGPGRLVPALLVGSALFQLAAWGLLAVLPRLATVLFYFQFNGMGALLVSAFWSLVNERFDPRTAKRSVALIGIAGTVGGVSGGLMAERVGALLSVSAMLPALSVLHLVAAALLLRVRAVPATSGAREPAPAVVQPAGFRALAASPYLRMLAAALILGTVSEGLLDYVFKASAKQAFGHGDALLRFFALFYTAINVLAGGVGAVLGRRALERLGLARTVGVLPWSVALGSAGAIAFPGLWAVVLARGAEATARNSLYRGGYELLFTPLPPEEKRAAKPLLDVGAVRAGDMLAAGLIQAALLVTLLDPHTLMLALAVLSAVAGIVLTIRLHGGYVAALERSLVARAGQLDMSSTMLDRTARMTMATMGITVDRARRSGRAGAATGATTGTDETDPALLRLAELHSSDPGRVRAALRAGPLEPVHVARAIELLGSDDVSHTALDVLSGVAARHTGQLVDALLDPASEFAVRRRVPAAIAHAASPRAVDGLLAGLHDPRFEVRVRCGRALAKVSAESPALVVDRARVLEAVLSEVAVGRQVWESQQPLGEDTDDPLELGDALRERSSRSLEHVFILLSLVLPRQPLQIAFQGLHTDDPQLRGTALEYLETALPVPVREKLWPFIGDRPAADRPSRPREQVVADLIAARSSIVLSLEDLEKLRDHLDIP